MKKILSLLSLYCFVVLCPAFATAELVPTKVEDSYFASTDIMAQGNGSCELSGTRTFIGDCDVEFLNLENLKTFAITLDNDGGQFRLDQINNGTSNQYITIIDGQEVPTSLEGVSQSESTITMDGLTLRIVLQQLFVRSES